MTTVPRVRLTVGLPVTLEQLAYVGQLEGRVDDLDALLDVDLAAELRAERSRAANDRRDTARLRNELDELNRHLAGQSRSINRFRVERDRANELARRALDLCQRQRALLRATQAKEITDARTA